MDPEIEARLLTDARKHGVSIEALLEKLTAEQLTPGETTNETGKAEGGSADLSTDSDDTDGGEAKGQRP